MNATAATTDGTNVVIIRHAIYQNDHVDYSWLLLALVAAAMIAVGLRKVFWNRSSN
jgi:hypothetical protein